MASVKKTSSSTTLTIFTKQYRKVSQHTEYIAFGEILFDEHNIEHTMPYLFNGKELGIIPQKQVYPYLFLLFHIPVKTPIFTHQKK